MKHLLNYHAQAIRLVLTRMRNNQFSSFMICLVIAVAMCIPSLFYVGVDHISNLTNHMQDETEISLFIKFDTSAETVSGIDILLAKNEAIKQFRLVTKDEAWRKLKAKSDVNNAVYDLTKNPLPDAFFIQAKSTDPETLEKLRNELGNIKGVEQALLNTEWAKRLATILALGNKIILFIAILLAFALLVIIGNTVRMQILTQKDEIEVSQLMGATTSFIRTPFLYAGILYGLFGGLLTILMIEIVIQIFNLSVTKISTLYSSNFSLNLFNANLFCIIIGSAILIGWLGSYLAVTRSVASINLNNNNR